MDTRRDKSVTTQETPPCYGGGDMAELEAKLRAPKPRKRGKPAAIVKFGSASVPVYQCKDGNSIRFVLSYHRNGQRMRQSFCSLPADRTTAAESITKSKTKSDTDVTVFSPDQMTTLLHAAPPHLIPLLAIGAFSGIRMAELARLDWRAVNLDRRIIEVRAGQAKTASRRVIPIPENLVAWLEPLPRLGSVLPIAELQRESAALARLLGIDWPRNVLRHSFISCRVAIVKSAEQVALEAGNSPSIIFKHYRELVTEDVAEKWFAILPKPDQMANRTSFDRKTGVVKILDPGEPEP